MLSLTILYENINDLSSKADRHLATKGCKTKGHIKFQLRATLFVLNVWDWLEGEKKNFWTELELNQGPLASKATALTTKLWPISEEINILLKPGAKLFGIKQKIKREHCKKRHLF